MKHDPIKPGTVVEVRHPFIRATYSGLDEDGPFETKCWSPGVRDEWCAPDDSVMVADGDGAQRLTVVSVHKPGRFPTRIFYTRQWVDPDGRVFGKGRLHIKTVGAFRQMVRGYRHDYRIATVQPQLVAAQ